MSEPRNPLPVPQPPPRPRRLRRFLLRHVPLALAGLVVLVMLATVGMYLWMSSAQFQNLVRRRLIAQLEQFTGGQVEVASFHWSLLQLEAEAGGLVIHGSEAAGEAPYARVDRLRVRFSLLDIWSPSVQLHDLEIDHPALHLIVYDGGSTNQPHPRKPRTAKTHPLDTLFNLKAGHISLVQGVLDYDNRAASFDFQDRWAPLDFQASNVSLRLSFVPPTIANPESYRIEAGATDLNLTRSLPSRTSKQELQQVHGYFQATLELMRDRAYLRSLRLTARSRDGGSHALEITGTLQDFARPRWQAEAAGDLDMRLLDSITGYPFAPQGIAHLDLAGAGGAGVFRIDGNLRVEDGSYIGTGVVATGLHLDTHVHADQDRLLITSIVARFRQGGQMEGVVDLSPWLPGVPGGAELRAAGSVGERAAPTRKAVPLHPPPSVIPMNGKVTSELKGVSLDTILDMVSRSPFKRLGIGALLNGSASAIWQNGNARTLTVSANLKLSPPLQTPAAESPASGAVDATYAQRDGSVALRKLEVDMPASQLTAHGNLGAYPVVSPTALTIDFKSTNLGEFDTVLRSLGLRRDGKAGTAALPAALTGLASFHGSWTGSLENPRLAGIAKATSLAIEIPAAGALGAAPGQSQFVHWDSVEATGSYSAARIAVEHAVLLRGGTKIALSGSLQAADASVSSRPGFDENSILHLRLEAAEVGIGDVQPFLTQKLPVTGDVDAQIQADGPIHALDGSGWIELDNGSLYGEPVTRVHAQGTLANDRLSLASVTLSEPAGSAAANGSYDLKSRRFQVSATGAGLDITKVGWLAEKGWPVTGRLDFSMHGSGTPDDPQLEAKATLNDLALSGEPVGELEFVAHTANRSLVYDMTSRLQSTELTVHGQTAIDGDYATQARLEFSRFNIDSLLKLAHVKALNGESALAGTVTVEGPLAQPGQLRGEASLQELDATIAGVHLKSAGGIHATLANNRIRMDPLHITGEDTDLRAQGSLALDGVHQLDLAASGSINLKLAETLDSDLTAGGTSTFQVEAHGPLKNPGLRGKIDFENGSLSFEDLPNGLSQLHGTLEFTQDRLEVRSLTAMSGGGPLSVAGYLAYQHGLYADLSVTGKGVRIRYPAGVSSLADATLHLQGPQNNLLLSGDALITRFSISPDLDIAALAAQADAVQTISAPDAPSNHIRLDVHIVSSPQLNFQNAFAKLAGDVDLHLRGTIATPALQGRISITEGNAIIAGTRYELQRGDISFTNPVRIEPLIDLSASARVEDYDITLSLHGTPGEMSVTYRSDPPLPESDVVALLALGRTENQQRIYTQQQEQALSSPTTDALLGGALNATVSSRVQRLFGAGSVKVDPNYLGPFGNSTSRIIVEEQLGRNLTLTYATDVNTTGQQLLQAEIAINRHVSLLVARDEDGVFSMVLKATRRFK